MAKKAKLEDIQSGIKCVDQLHTKNASIYNGDSTEIIKMIPDESIDLAVFSPRFSRCTHTVIATVIWGTQGEPMNFLSITNSLRKSNFVFIGLVV